MPASDDLPTRAQFQDTTRRAFAFLKCFGFEEMAAPLRRAGDPFQVWYQAGPRFVVVLGEGYGTAARVMLESGDGMELAEIYLVPPEARPKKSKADLPPLGQLEQIQEAARRLERYGADFLAGDERRFRARAKPLLPYKRPQGG